MKMTEQPEYSIKEGVKIPDGILKAWQKLLELISEVFDVPAALIRRVHTHQVEVFICSSHRKNGYVPNEMADLDTGIYCETVMATRQYLLVPNALNDPKWNNNPDIALGMIAYLGFPVSWPDGELFGTICVLDHKENDFSGTYVRLLEQFRKVVEEDIKLISTELLLRESEIKYQALFDSVSDAIFVSTPDGNILDTNKKARKLTGLPPDKMIGIPVFEMLGLDQSKWYNEVEPALESGHEFHTEVGQTPDGGERSHAEVGIIKMVVKERQLAITIVHDITQRKAFEEQLLQLAMTDPLTGAYNRTRFKQDIEQLIQVTDRHHRPLSLAMIDVDHFKQINDTYGHLAGDNALTELVEVILPILRQGDRLYRYGGEEFIILMSETDLIGANQLAERIRSKVEVHRFDTIDHLTISIGVAYYLAGQGEKELLVRADSALYAAKRKGRNRMESGVVNKAHLPG